MKSPILLALGTCLLAGCTTTDRLETARQEQAREDHYACVNYGTVPGTAAYDQCRDRRATNWQQAYGYDGYDPYYNPYYYNDYAPAAGYDYPRYPREADRR